MLGPPGEPGPMLTFKAKSTLGACQELIIEFSYQEIQQNTQTNYDHFNAPFK